MINEIFERTQASIQQQGFEIITLDHSRPWGGFFVIEEKQAQKFSDVFFDGMDISTQQKSNKLSPKILLVAPHKRLSWQYHHRRAEIWRVFEGRVGVIRSHDDHQGNMELLEKGSQILLQQGERHRLIGLEDWAVVAEIWQHTDPENPSNEEDIVRLQDDFGR